MSFYKAEPLFMRYEKKISDISIEFPFIKVESIGLSVLERKLYSLSIGDKSNCILYAGAFHGQEWLTSMILLRFLEELAYNYKNNKTVYGIDVKKQIDKRGVAFIPMVNPDGVSIALEGPQSAGKLKGDIIDMMKADKRTWQANARGVDLNHNFDAGFYTLKEIEKSNNINKPCPRQYGGESPQSEPETKFIVDFTHKRECDMVYAFHSQGEEIFYEYGENTPISSYSIAKTLSSLSGYRLVENNSLYSHGGFKDWFIEKEKKSGFTIEVGKGENPLPVSDLEDIYKKIHKMLFVSINL